VLSALTHTISDILAILSRPDAWEHVLRGPQIRGLLLFLTTLSPLALLVYLVVERSARTVLIYLAFIGLFVVMNQTFFTASTFAFHDTMADHHIYYAILNEWLRNGYAVGWNPFMNGGEPLYLYSNFFLWAEFVTFSMLNSIFGLPIPHLINIYTCFIVVSFATYCLLLFHFVLGEKFSCFFAFSAVLLGGLMTSTLAQFMLSPFYLLPLSSLSFFLWLTRARWVYASTTIFLIAVSANHYIPNYLILTLAIVSAAAILVWLLSRLTGHANPLLDKEAKTEPITTRDRRIALMANAGLSVCTVGTVAAAFFVFQRVQDLISPVRGNLTLADHGIGLQALVDASPDQYKFLVWMPRIFPGLLTRDNLIYAHSPFLIGVIAVLMVFASPTMWRSRHYMLWLYSTIGIILFGLGHDFPPWVFLRDHVPFFYLRHAYPLSIPITLFLLILAGFGFQKLCRSRAQKMVVCASSILFTLLLVSHGTLGDRRPTARIEERPFHYPLTRTPYTLRSSDVPIDAMPILLKEASAANASDDYVLFRTPGYQSFLERNLSFASGPIFGFERANALAEPPTSSPALDATEQLKNGGFASWDPPRTVAGISSEVPHAFTISPVVDDLAFHPAPRSDKPDGERGLRVELTAKQRLVIFEQELTGTTQLLGHYVQAEICLSSPQTRRVLVELQIAEKDGKTTRSPRTVALGPSPECPQAVFYVEPTTTGVTYHVMIYTPEPEPIDIHRVSLKRVLTSPAAAEAIPIELAQGDNPNHVQLRLNAPADGFLTRKENFDPGWTAVVNGVPASIKKWGPFQAIPVRAGENAVELTFSSIYPALFWLHVVMTLLGYVIFFATLAGERATGGTAVRRKRDEEGSGAACIS
jgi:hypothetical protein